MDTRLPPYRWIIGETLLSNQHRSVMNSVTMQVLPLRADMATLRRFIDSYLNFVDDEEPPPFYFKPAAPFVLLELLHYPYLSVPARNLAAYSQHEVSFTIPLECYAVENGILVFKGFANTTPFIYLNQQVSIISGRDLFGLPKVDCAFDTVHPPDIPNARTPILNLRLRVSSATGDTYVSFVEVLREPRPFSSVRESPREVLEAIPSRIADYHRVVMSAWESMSQMPMSGYEGIRDAASINAMAGAGIDSMFRSYPQFVPFRFAPVPLASTADADFGPTYIDLISLKENRDAQYPDLVSFQSIVRSTMYVDRVNDGGPLFNPMGRSSVSDVLVQLHRVSSQPLIETLGLEVVDSVSLSSSPATGTETAASQIEEMLILRPVFPFWANVDLTYGLGTNLYWRSTHNGWSFDEEPDPMTDRENRYITFGGGAQLEDPACLVVPEGNIWVWALPLKDNGKTQLARSCETYLANSYFDFRLCKEGKFSDFVWLILRNVTNTASGGGPRWEQELTFAVFVELFPKDMSDRIGTLLFPIYSLTDSESRDLTNNEMFGQITGLADFESVGADWTSSRVGSGARGDLHNFLQRNLMSSVNVSTSVLPVLFAGKSPEQRLLLQITPRDAVPPNPVSSPKTPQPPPKSSKRTPSFTKDPPPYLVSLSLKQVMDCRFPEAASYQAIILDAMKIEKAKPEQTLDVKIKISRYTSLPLVETLCLKASTEAGQFTTIDVVEPDPSYSWRLITPIEEKGAFDLLRREGAGPWYYSPQWEDEFDEKVPGVLSSMRALNDYLRSYG